MFTLPHKPRPHESTKIRLPYSNRKWGMKNGRIVGCTNWPAGSQTTGAGTTVGETNSPSPSNTPSFFAPPNYTISRRQPTRLPLGPLPLNVSSFDNSASPSPHYSCHQNNLFTPTPHPMTHGSRYSPMITRIDLATQSPANGLIPHWQQRHPYPSMRFFDASQALSHTNASSWTPPPTCGVLPMQSMSGANVNMLSASVSTLVFSLSFLGTIY